MLVKGVGRGGGAQDPAALAAEALFKEQMRHFVHG